MLGKLIGTAILALAAATAGSACLAGESAAPPAGLEGADAPAFQTALEHWLEGDDAQSLPVLSQLANDGNLAAQVLLGIIYDRTLSRTPWVAGLSRSEQRALFRYDDGAFGVPWLRYAAEHVEVADVLGPPVPDENGRFNADAALRAAALGEPRSSVYMLVILMNQGDWAEAMRLGDVAEIYDLQGVAWAAATYLESDDAFALRERGLAEFQARTMQGWIFASMANRIDDPEMDRILGPFDEMRIYITRGRPPLDTAEPPPAGGVEALDALLADAPEAELVRRYCGRICGSEAAQCTRQIYGLLSGYGTLPYVVSSPLETLVPQDVYLASHRAELVLEQYALHTTYAANDPQAAFDGLELTQCLADALRSAIIPR
ncbi:MAG: hypothetical protein KDA64_05720 [Rhodospirillaceae bacterium]|nr:hypothetical protein [Rhodospirillaceae bacterium]